MDPRIQEGAKRQLPLEVAKAAFLLSGGLIQPIATGQGSGNKTGLTLTESFAQSKGAKAGRASHAAEQSRKRALLEQSVRYCAEQGMTKTQACEAVGCKRTMVSTVAKEFGIEFKCVG